MTEQLLEFRLGIAATDFDASVRFYRDALGMQVHRAWNRGGDDFGIVFQAAGGFVEILPESSLGSGAAVSSSDSGPAKPFTWLYIEVPDIDEAYRRLLKHGAAVLLPPTDEPWGHRRLRVRDPDGLHVGLFARLATKE